MASKHLEQVQKLAEAQKACKATFGDHPFNSLQDFLAVCKPLEFPFSAIAAHLAYLERVEAAAQNRHDARRNFEFLCDETAAKWLSASDEQLSAALASKDKANAK
jgi:hypothetical protein